MPRKASTTHPDVAPAIAKITQYCHDTKTSILSLSRSANVGQPALFRFVKGERVSVTGTARTVLLYIDNAHKTHNLHNGVILKTTQANNLGGQDIIDNAVASLWDGTQRSAELIASLVLALKPALDIASNASINGQKEK